MNIERRSPRIESETRPVLTEEEAIRVMYKSFELSQGYVDIQKSLLALLSKKYTEHSFDTEHAAKIFADKITSTRDTTSHNSHRLAEQKLHQPVTGSIVASEPLESYFSILKGESYDYTDEKLELIFYRALWYRDHHWLVDKGGRPNRDLSHDGTNTPRDRWYSYAVDYLLRGKTTGVRSIDELLADYIQSNPYPNYSIDQHKIIDEVIRAYNEHHPATPVESPVSSL